ncbi:MAG TPA: Uma2 family endonuclease [Armatimonadota bacterium]
MAVERVPVPDLPEPPSEACPDATPPPPPTGSPPPVGLSFEQYLDWLDEDTHAEWVGGEIRLMSPVSRGHNSITRFLLRLLSEFVEARDLGEVLYEPFQVRLTPEVSRSPDVLFVAREHLDRVKPTYLDGAPDLAIEVVSPESAARDRGEKFYEYEQAGVAEYWLIDPIRKLAEFYEVDSGGHYRAASLTDGIYRSSVLPGFWLREEWLWQEPLPKVPEVLKEWNLR